MFVPLDDFYDVITFMEPSTIRVQHYRNMFDDIDDDLDIDIPKDLPTPRFELAQSRDAAPLDLSRRLMTS